MKLTGYQYLKDVHLFSPIPDISTAATFLATSGFEATSFINSTELVISYADTDFSWLGTDFWNGNIQIQWGFALFSEQPYHTFSTWASENDGFVAKRINEAALSTSGYHHKTTPRFTGIGE